MKKILVDVFASHYGTILRLATSAIVGLIVSAFAHFQLDLSGDAVAAIGGIASTIVAGVIGEYILKDARTSIQQVQEILQPIAPEVNQDRRLGPVTIAAVEKAVEVTKAAPAEVVAAAEERVNLSKTTP